MDNGFRFKQFSVRHDQSTMRVGTDAVLLGAWCPLPVRQVPWRVLDVGTGSGVIALMLAQRLAKECPQHSDWHIDAVDIDPLSVAQAADNFAASPWSAHLHAALCRVQDMTGSYQLVVSNPPFFSSGVVNPDPRRAMARQAALTLPFDDLVQHALRLLAPDGCLAVIVPAWEEQRLLGCLADTDFRLSARCAVRSKEQTPLRRVMLLLTRSLTPDLVSRPIEQLTLMDEQGQRSPDYARLTRDFYL